MVPAAFVMMESLPLTPNGKLDRQRLPAPDKPDAQSARAYVAPRNPLEAQLAALWEEVLGVSPVGVTDDFFDLGGHSLSAVRLAAKARKELGRKIPLSMLLQERTVGRLATALSGPAAARHNSLVAIRPGGSKRPFFCVHPSGGGVLCYEGLARHLGEGRPFYGLQDSTLEEEREPYDDMRLMATHYVEALRTVQPRGPYSLGGYSFGGMVAFEMAQQLRTEGEEVAALVMLDSVPPTGARQSFDLYARLGLDEDLMLFLDFKELAEQAGKRLEVQPAELLRLGPDERLAHVLERMRAAQFLSAEVDTRQLRCYMQMYRGRREAIKRYEWRTYPGRVTLFRTDAPPKEPPAGLEELLSARQLEEFRRGQEAIFGGRTYGWDELSSEPVEVHTAPGDHYTMLLEPNVQLLARQLTLCLDATQDNGGA
jgi:thioesterase domain-containing protein/acyl carrier protein